MKKISLIVSVAWLAAMGASAATTNLIEEWTFDTEATANVGVNGGTMDVWDPTATGNSWSGGVLTWSERGGAAAVSLPGGSIDTSTINELILTVEMTDMALPVDGGSTKDAIRMFFNTTGTTPELEINTFDNTQISPDIEYAASTGDLDINMFVQDDFTAPFAVTMVTTWDFANNEMRFSATGPGGPWSGSVTVANLASSVGTINSFDLNFSDNVAGSFLVLDNVKIETVEYQGILLEEDFEDGSYDFDTSGNAPDVISIYGNQVMKSQLTSSSADPERTEVTLNESQYNFDAGEEYWVGARIKIDEDFVDGAFEDQGMLMQLHYRDTNYGDGFSPQPFILRYQDGVVKVQYEHIDENDDNIRTTLRTIVPVYGEWVDWVFRIRLDEGTDGLFQVWRNGVQILDWTGDNHLALRPDGAYLKFGLYSAQYDDQDGGTRMPAGYSRTVYHDEVRIADAAGSYAMVAPQGDAPLEDVVEQWTFDEPGAETGVNGSTLSIWDPDATGNSHSGGVLTWSERGDATAVSLPGGAIDTSTLDALILTVEFADIFIDTTDAAKDTIRMFFGATGGQPEIEINAFNGGQIAPDIEFNGDTGDLDVTLFDQDNYTEPTPITMVITWDFENNQMLFSGTGTGGPFSGSIAADLSGITSIDNFDLNFSNVDAASFAALDTVTIQAIEKPVAPLEYVVEQWTFDAAHSPTGVVNGTVVSTWTTNAPNSVVTNGVLQYAKTGDANFTSGQLLPDIDTSTISQLVMTVEVADLYVAPNDVLRFVFEASGSNPEVEFTSWGSGTFAPDIEYNGSTDDLDVTTDMNFASNPSGAGGPATFVTTWDFANNAMSFEASGSVNGSGTKSTASDLSDSVGTIQGFRVRRESSTGNSWMDLDTVTIQAIGWGSGPTSSGIDLRAVQAADGVYVEFVAYVVEEEGTIELQLLDENGGVVWSDTVGVTAGPQSIARFLVPGLDLGESYDFRVRDEVGKWWNAEGVTVGSFDMAMTSATLAGITLTFDSLPDRTYEIQWADTLGGTWQTITNLTAAGEQTDVVVAFPESTTPGGFFRVLDK